MGLRSEYKFDALSVWISRHPAFKLGYSVMDVDQFVENHWRGYCMHLEFKNAGERVSPAQMANIQMIADVWTQAEPHRIYQDIMSPMKYKGYFIIQLLGDTIDNESGIIYTRIGAHCLTPKVVERSNGAETELLKIMQGEI